MSTTEKKPANIVSPAGIAKWVCVNKPSTKFNADGMYEVSLLLEAGDGTTAFEARLKKIAEEAKAEFIRKLAADPKTRAKAAKVKSYGLNYGLSAATDDEGNETGDLIFKAKQVARITSKKDQKVYEKRIAIFDAKGKPFTGKNIGKGSKLKVSFSTFPFCMDSTQKVGISIRLVAVQVIEFVEYVPGQNAEGYGFGEEEGFTADDAPASESGETTEGGEAPAGDAGNGDF